MTEAQKEFIKAYKEMVGEEVVTKQDLKDWTAGLYPISLNTQPKLKPDRENAAGIVPTFTRTLLPQVEYNMTTW